MPQLLTNRFRIHTILCSVNAIPWRKHMFLGRSTKFTNDSVPPFPIDNVADIYIDAYEDMIVTKTIEADDVSFTIPRVDWVSGTVYTEYEHDDAEGMPGKQFYVVVETGASYDVFKCLGNNNGSPSTVAPDLTQTAPDDDVYITSDGYQWKFMYTMSRQRFEKFATVDYMPVIANTAVVANAVSGSIDKVKVTYNGSNYDSYTGGSFQAINVSGNNQVFYIETSASPNSSFYDKCALKVVTGAGAGQQRTITNYYVSGSTRQVTVDTPFSISPNTLSTYEISPTVTLVGSGNGFIGRALVNSTSSNSVYAIEITDRGRGYNWATAILEGNTGGVSNTAALKPILSPQGGHGSDPVEELYSHYLTFSADFDIADPKAAGKMLNVNDFRTVGIILDPLLSNVELSYTGGSGTFVLGEVVRQANVLAANGVVTYANSSTLRLTGVYGNFIAANDQFIVVGANSSATGQITSVRLNRSANLSGNVVYTNETTRFNISSPSGSFALDEIITGTANATTSSAKVYFANSSQIWVTQKRGTFGNSILGITSGTTATLDSETSSDMIKGLGDILYIENISPINRSNNQTETVKVIIEY